MQRSTAVSGYAESLRQHMADDRNLVRAFRLHPNARSVRFASDYSEIHAYSHVLQAQPVSYFAHYNKHKQIALNEAWATRLFFDPDSRPLLLDPYRIELASLVASTALEPLAHFVEAAAKLRQGEQTPDEWLQWLKGIDEALDNASPQLTLDLLTQIYDRAPGLMLLISDDLKPSSRLRHLLRTANFDTLGRDLSGVSAETQHWWIEQMRRKRPTAAVSSNVIDGIAVAQLQAINRDPRATRSTVLVTRSETMRRILSDRPSDSEAANAFDKATDRVFVVHPRVLGSYLVAERSGASAREIIENRYWLSRETMSLFDRHSFEDRDSYDLRSMIKKVRDLWAEVDDVSIVQSIWSEKGSTAQLAKAGKDTLKAVRDVISGQKTVRNLLSERGSDVANELSLNNAMIAAVGVIEYGQAEPHPMVDVRQKTVIQADRPSLTVRAASRLMQYSLQLYKPEFATYWRQTEGNALAALSQFVKAQMPGTGYERLLGTGYTLAAVGSWEVAYQFFNLAVTFDSQNEDLPRHEAYYFRALARRYASEKVSPAAIQLSFTDLEMALADKRRLRGEGYIDPRYYCEIGVLLAQARQCNFKVTSTLLDTRDPVTVWRRALREVIDDKALRVQLLNNIVYYLHTRRTRRSDTPLRRAFADLVDAAAVAGIDQVTYNVEHTIIVVTLARGGGTREELEAARTKLLQLQGLDGTSANLKDALQSDLAGIAQRLAALEKR